MDRTQVFDTLAGIVGKRRPRCFPLAFASRRQESHPQCRRREEPNGRVVRRKHNPVLTEGRRKGGNTTGAQSERAIERKGLDVDFKDHRERVPDPGVG